MELDEKNKAIIKEFFKNNDIGAAMFKSMNTTIKRVYVDMEMLFDYKLTAYLLLLKTEEEYNYVLKNLDKYRLFKGTDITKVFPKLPYTYQDLLNLINNEDVWYYLSTRPLITNISNVLPIQLTTFTTANYSNPTYDKSPIKVRFVNQLFPVHPDAQAHITNSLSGIIKNIKCEFDHCEICNDTVNNLSENDLYLIYDMKRFLTENSNAYKLFFEEKKMNVGSFIADFKLDDDEPFVTEEKKELFTNTETFFSEFSYFYFLDRQLLKQFPEETKNK